MLQLPAGSSGGVANKPVTRFVKNPSSLSLAADCFAAAAPPATAPPSVITSTPEEWMTLLCAAEPWPNPDATCEQL